MPPSISETRKRVLTDAVYQLDQGQPIQLGLRQHGGCALAVGNGLVNTAYLTIGYQGVFNLDYFKYERRVKIADLVLGIRFYLRDG